jgi:CHASE3 domain sensor protein
MSQNQSDLIKAILALRQRIESLEAENKALKDQFNGFDTMIQAFVAFMTEYVDRQDAKDEAAPTIVDADGIVTAAAEGLIQKVDALRADMTESMESLKRMFHQHLADHEINGARPAMLQGVELRNALKDL